MNPWLWFLSYLCSTILFTIALVQFYRGDQQVALFALMLSVYLEITRQPMRDKRKYLVSWKTATSFGQTIMTIQSRKINAESIQQMRERIVEIHAPDLDSKRVVITNFQLLDD